MIINSLATRPVGSPPLLAASPHADEDFVATELSPSKVALRLSRRYRLARLNPTKKDVLSAPAHAQLVYRWLLKQVLVSRGALQSVQEIPGISVDPHLTYAVDLTMQKRVEVYAATPFFFEEGEALTRSIADYADALRSQHQRAYELHRAMATLSEAQNESGRPGSRDLMRARKAVRRARALMGAEALRTSDQRLLEAKSRMRHAAALIEHRFKLTTMLPDYLDIPPEDSEGVDDIQRKSSSCQQQLRPSQQRPRM